MPLSLSHTYCAMAAVAQLNIAMAITIFCKWVERMTSLDKCDGSMRFRHASFRMSTNTELLQQNAGRDLV
jgi:hypothetical protein